MRQTAMALALLWLFLCPAPQANAVDPTGTIEPASLAELTWDFEGEVLGELAGNARVEPAGPTAAMGFVGLPESNRALVLGAPGGFVRVVDTADDGPLDFRAEECITIEAWVRLDGTRSSGYVYLVGKGRTYETGVRENHNYALRLALGADAAKPSFLFSTQRADGGLQYHRWTAKSGFAPDRHWHHVAVAYQFGHPDSIRGYVDGRPTGGRWDMAGPTTAAPVVDNDSLWIGSARGGAPESSLVGAIDDVRIHRRLIKEAEIATRRVVPQRVPQWPQGVAADQVAIVLSDRAPSHSAFPTLPITETFRFSMPRTVLHRLPARFLPGGIRGGWSGPVLGQLFVQTALPAGPIELLIRSPGKSRLWIDGQIVLETPPRRLFPDAHQPFVEYDPVHPAIRTPHVGDQERIVDWLSDGRAHTFVLETLIGSSSSRCEPGETVVAWRRPGGMFEVLAPQGSDFGQDELPEVLPLTDTEFERYLQWADRTLNRLDDALLRQASSLEDDFWHRRHVLARRAVAGWDVASSAIPTDLQSIDDLLESHCLESGASQAEIQQVARPLDDLAFYRRLSLDTIGVPPSLAEVQQYLDIPADSRRGWAIEQRLADPRWADHWTSLWQDLLAENPNILKPSLNNTGPFRFWIHDSLAVNKPLDRFVTELIRMEGDPFAGGPAGFGMATQNDVPMAEKAHVIVAAFLGENLKCARCHDAPYHPWTQRDLFQVAALLAEKPISVPATSSVPAAFFERRGGDAPIRTTLHPGDEVSPAWPAQLLPDEVALDVPLDPELLGRADGPRERLAALITRGENRRFPRVVVNRVWQRLMGWAFVTEASDWHDNAVHNAALLDFLARGLVESGYDFKELVRSIVSSDVYGRSALDPAGLPKHLRHAGPWRRRLTAEQLVDSLHAAMQVEMSTEPITFDPEGSQKRQNFLNLGPARRAWQLTSLANERDRPSLSLPRAGAVVECLEAFGWQAARQSPVEHRQVEPNVIQPSVLANGNLTTYVTRMSDRSGLTIMAQQAKTPNEFIDCLYLMALTRHPTPAEREELLRLIEPGFENRVRPASPPAPSADIIRGFVTWSNHFDVRSNKLMRDLEARAAMGPQPTTRLVEDWRERAEDAAWALLNLPEFQFVP
ncbi:MAG: DUF1553 domain-containing protein [Planctomycetota bacterium]|nr:MAG: DUF1553 domain-containing protein [Planctomycetota bacterium]